LLVKQIDLEREAKAALSKEKDLVERALQAEQRLKEAVKQVRRPGGVLRAAMVVAAVGHEGGGGCGWVRGRACRSGCC
jgi:hypothetical protein